MSPERKEIFEFGEFRLDVDEHAIERVDGMPNGALTEKAFQVLVLLVRRGGHLVTKDELIRFVWPDTIVEDNNLEKCVHHLRQFLGETSNGTKYIETVRKHGYRFVEKVEAVEVSASWLPETFRTGDRETETSRPLGDADRFGVASPKDVKKNRNPSRRAVLLTVLILAFVGGIAALGDYFFVRRGVEVVDAFPAKRGTDNEEANRLYLLALNLSEERGVQNGRKALEYLDRAVALDPNYALAWAAKANVHASIVASTDSGQHEHFPRSMEAIEKALAIDPNLSEAYSALCHYKNRYEYDVAGAETACKRAVELDGNSPVAHKTYANFLYTRGRFDEAIVEIKTAMDLQPVSYRNQQMYALTLYFARRYPEAEDQFKRLIELNPNHGYIHGRLIRVLEDQGKEAEAFQYLLKMLTIQQADSEKLERFNLAYETAGWRGVAIEQIKTAEAAADPDHFQLACLHSKIGNRDKALEHLEKAYEERSFQIAILQVEPQLDPLRNDPRFAELIGRIYGD